jgi:hypothetical protein
MRIAYLTFFLLVGLYDSFSQSAGDYRSASGGSWTDAGVWQRYDGTSWVAAPSAPVLSDGVITVQAGHAINVLGGNSVSADQVVVEGNLTVSSGATFTLANGTGSDLVIASGGASLTVNGNFIRQNLTEIANIFGAANIVFGPDGIYSHAYTTSVGDMPAATWSATSTLQFTGFANTTPITANATWNQVYGNVVFNSPGQGELVNFAGNIRTIKGNLTVLSTGKNAVQLSDNETVSIEIGTAGSQTGGDLTIAGGRLFVGNSGTVDLTIHGNLTHTSSHSWGSYLTVTGTTVVDVYGIVTIDATGTGKLRLAGAGTTGESTLNLHNDFLLLSGRLDEAGSDPSRGNLNFLKAGTQTFVNAGAIVGYINYTIGGYTILDAGTSLITGAVPSAFTMKSGSTIILGSLDTSGALTLGGAGNIRTSGAYRTYEPGTTLIYRGAATQFLGNGHPATEDVTVIFDNPAGVKLNANRIIGNHVVLESGVLDLNGYTLTLTAQWIRNGGYFGGNTASKMIIAGTGDGLAGSLYFDPGVNNLGTLTINRAGVNATVTLETSLNLSTALDLLTGAFVNNSTLTLANNALVTRYERSSITGNAIQVISGDTYNISYKSYSPGGGPYASYTTGAELSANPEAVGSFTITLAQQADEIGLNKHCTINGVVTLVRGNLIQNQYNITMAGPGWYDNGGTFVPGSGSVIFNAITEVNGTSNPRFGSIVTNSGSTVNFLRSFSVLGNVSFSETSVVNMYTSTVTLAGNDTQNISGGGMVFPNVIVSKGTGTTVELSGLVQLTGVLQFLSPSSNVDFRSNGFLRLVSSTDAAGSGTASIYRLWNGNTVSGAVDVQRYMSGEGKIYRYFSSPVSNSNVEQLKDDFMVGGSFIDPSPTQTICGVKALSTTASLFYYDERIEGDVNQGWIAYPSSGTAAGNPLIPGLGYSAYIRQCTEPTIIDFQGTVNSGNINLPVTYTVSDPSADGWNLVGNPYPSAVDWDFGWNKTRISPAIAIMDNGTGMMRYYEAGVTEDIPNGQIALGQGFWVRATAPNPALRISELAKITSVPEFFREANPVSIPSLSVSLSDGRLTDKAYVKNVSGADHNLDSLDAPKILNPQFNLAFLSSDNIEMAINALADLECGMKMPLITRGLTAGAWTLSLDTRGFFTDRHFILYDSYLKKETVFTNSTIAFLVNNDSASAAASRFVIRVGEKPVRYVTVLNASACSNDAEVSIGGVENGRKYAIWTSDGRQLTAYMESSNGSELLLKVPADSLNAESNSLVVKIAGSCSGDLLVSGDFTVIKGNPAAPEVLTQFACKSGSVRLIANASTPDVSFRWYERSGDVTPLFVGSVFETPELTKPKTYFVECVGRNGCVSERVSVTAEIINFTPVAINTVGTTLASNHLSGNQWYFEGTLIEGAVGQTLAMTKPGLYSVSHDLKGCISTADYRLENQGIQFFPNPAVEVLNIYGLDDDVTEIGLVSLMGARITQIYRKGEKFDGSIDITTIPDGVYLLIVTRGEATQSHRFIKRAK